jgi:hypothetical protein
MFRFGLRVKIRIVNMHKEVMTTRPGSRSRSHDPGEETGFITDISQPKYIYHGERGEHRDF